MKRQLGLSMIELLVALAISSFLILGVTQIFIDNKQNYLYQQGQSENQENGRFTLMFLERQLGKAGYRRDPRSDMAIAFPRITGGQCQFQAGQAVLRVDDNTLCIRYQPRIENEMDCTGKVYDGSSDVTLPYADTFNGTDDMVEEYVLDNGRLTCNGEELVTGIQAGHFDFGVNDQLDAKEIREYKTQPAADDIVRSLRYSFLMIATPNNLTRGMSYRACDRDWEAVTGQAPNCEDGKLYQMVSSSTTLRNLMP